MKDEKKGKEGVRHLVECHCILPQYRDRMNSNPVFHKFIVFSVVDESDTVVPKYVQCNNCSVVHKVYDLCKSEIMGGKDELRSVTTIEEVRLGMNIDVQNVLDTYSCDLSTWEQTRFLIDNELWDKTVILTQDSLDDVTQGKMLRILSSQSFRIESFIRKDLVENK